MDLDLREVVKVVVVLGLGSVVLEMKNDDDDGWLLLQLVVVCMLRKGVWGLGA